MDNKRPTTSTHLRPWSIVDDEELAKLRNLRDLVHDLMEILPVDAKHAALSPTIIKEMRILCR